MMKKAGEQETKEESKEKPQILHLVSQLPTQPVRMIEDDEAIHIFTTIEEKITIIESRLDKLENKK